MRVIPPPLLFLACLTVGSFLQYRRPFPIGSYHFRVGASIGVCMLAVAAIIGGWALREMFKLRTPVEPWETPRHLVTSGPFRISRNPLYLTLTLTLFALAVMANSAWLVASAIALVVLLDRLVIKREEEVLTREFGDEYTRYRSRVRRWV